MVWQAQLCHVQCPVPSSAGERNSSCHLHVGVGDGRRWLVVVIIVIVLVSAKNPIPEAGLWLIPDASCHGAAPAPEPNVMPKLCKAAGARLGCCFVDVSLFPAVAGWAPGMGWTRSKSRAGRGLRLCLQHAGRHSPHDQVSRHMVLDHRRGYFNSLHGHLHMRCAVNLPSEQSAKFAFAACMVAAELRLLCAADCLAPYNDARCLGSETLLLHAQQGMQLL